TSDVAARVLLARRHHTRIPEATVRAQATAWAHRFGLPGLPSGPARLLTEADLRRAACVRTFLGRPRLVILELAGVAQHGLLADLLGTGAEVRSHGAAVMWLATAESMLRDRAIRPTHRLRLNDAGLSPLRLTERAA